MNFFSIEFLLYPSLALILIFILFFLIKATGFTSLETLFGGLFLAVLFWIIIYFVLSFFYTSIPCVNILGSYIGGC